MIYGERYSVWAMDGENTLPVHMELRGPKHTQTIVLLDAGCSPTSQAWIIINVCVFVVKCNASGESM